MKKRAILCLVLGAAGLLLPAAAEAGTLRWDSYAVKFVCGAVVRGPGEAVVDGKYKTAVNIHNPHYLMDAAGAPIPVQFFKKIVLAPAQGEPSLPPSCFIEEILDADHALSVNCRNIQAQLAISGLPSAGPLEGYVVLLVPPFQGVDEANPPVLDVSGVYSARTRAEFADIQINGNGAAALDVEYVDPKQVRGSPSLDLCLD